MATDWLPASDVLAYLKVGETSENAEVVELCRLAAARVIAAKRPDLNLDTQAAPAPGVEDGLEAVRHGATLLAARLYARKGSPMGVATFGELGAATILRTDPDIALLCGIGRHARPVAR